MPGKHVRFSDKDIIHPPPTLPSSPPAFPPALSTPLPNPSIPPSFAQSIRPTLIHPLLRSYSAPIINFDLRQSPSTITSDHQRLSRRVFYEPATYPPLQSLTISNPDLPWTVTVTASRVYVTVQDVLDELYHFLRTNISAQEFNALPNDQARRRVARAYEERYQRITVPREREDEKGRGVVRVDFLMGRTKFMGLSPTYLRTDHFLLHSV